MKQQLINEDFNTPDGVYGHVCSCVDDGVCKWSCWAHKDGVKCWQQGSFPVKAKHEPKPDAEQILAARKALVIKRVLAALAVV